MVHMSSPKGYEIKLYRPGKVFSPGLTKLNFSGPEKYFSMAELEKTFPGSESFFFQTLVPDPQETLQQFSACEAHRTKPSRGTRTIAAGSCFGSSLRSQPGHFFDEGH